MGFTTVPDALRAAEVVAAGAVTALRGADCGAPLAGLGPAVPGGNAAVASGSYAGSWSAACASWCDRAAGQARSLRQAADTYAVAESGNARRLDGHAGARLGPR